jgi:hypothetical protein
MNNAHYKLLTSRNKLSKEPVICKGRYFTSHMSDELKATSWSKTNVGYKTGNNVASVTMFKLVKASACRLRGNDIQILSAVVGWEEDRIVRHDKDVLKALPCNWIEEDSTTERVEVPEKREGASGKTIPSTVDRI